MHQARTGTASYRDGSHWAPGDAAVLHPGRIADCALCLLADDHDNDQQL